jgi:capsular polysaccharide biosynthesis protein
MNIEVVKSVFGAVSPAPVIPEKTSNLIPALMLVVLVGVGYIIYTDSKVNYNGY